MNKPVEQLPTLSDQLKIRSLEVKGADGPLAARLYTSGDAGAKRDTLLVFFHAGGFVGGDLEDADVFLRHLADDSQQMAVLASAYTLATEKPFPAAVEDAHAVLVWAKKHKAKLGWTGKQLLVAGIEAGANLAAVCALMSRDRGGPALAGQVLVMPMLDPGLTTCSMRELQAPELLDVADACAKAYRGYLPNAADRTHPYASPLQSSRLKNLPPALILSTEDDPLRDEAEQYGAKLIANGVKTTVRRMQPAPLQDAEARNECACRCQALGEIAGFVAGLERSETPPAA
ncbi:alpha/beta hydrolase fold domain-containing protein [Duganella sp. FT80W]|uniref:Alpha/beta hydrolase fold domain-containing protein n=1 Tax=Duganella guangzhouensis TaxID=2666084 RepID=A0A6I2KSK1_9BURK|nr:alpha/beta hydrolase [Duganella guangzhouensis]MRW88688.1 alpha/beta hydrolase fold domain-containing protein [Duganella guangzhouensis]